MSRWLLLSTLALPRRTVVAGAITCALSLGGCCEGVMCGPCGEPIYVDATDSQTGEPILEPVCELASDGRSCIMVSEPGSYAVEVSAPGYVGVLRNIEVLESDGDGCCDCGYEYVTVTVALDPE
ncbi:MAG: hypothetical protein JRI68_30410 [Deltaproteobacteria bacterium]|nr:hypothetical protein [Deltaproteobacteria bacterium]